MWYWVVPKPRRDPNKDWGWNVACPSIWISPNVAAWMTSYTDRIERNLIFLKLPWVDNDWFLSIWLSFHILSSSFSPPLLLPPPTGIWACYLSTHLIFFHPLFTSWFSNFFALGSQVRLLWNNQMIEAFFAHAENKHSWLYTVTVTVLTTLPPPLLFYSFCYQKPKQREVKNTTRATANNLSIKHIKTTWILHLKTRGQRDICRSNLPAPPRPGLGE